ESGDTAGDSTYGSLSVLGGLLSADQVNFNSPGGQMKVSVDRIDGKVNLSGATADVLVLDGDLRLNLVNLTGDPIFAAGGNLDLSSLFDSGPNFQTFGGDFVALAGGDITADTAPSNAVIDASSQTGPGGHIHLEAGIDFTTGDTNCQSCATEYTI